VTATYAWGNDLSGSRTGAGGVGGLLWVAHTQHGRHFYGYDDNGNVCALTSATNGTRSGGYEYDPFGQLIRVDPAAPVAAWNQWRFSTKRSDPASGTVLYEYRAYSPPHGRWLSRDPIGENGGANSYGFVNNTPVNAIDPIGRDVVYLLDPSAVGGAGHAAVLIGNDQDGWSYFSFGPGKCMLNPFGGNNADNLDTKGLNNFSAARQDASLARYKRYARWNTDKAADRKALEAMKQYFDKSYNICTRNCDDVAADAIKAAGESFNDKWKPVTAYDANKGNADESGEFPQQPAPRVP